MRRMLLLLAVATSGLTSLAPAAVATHQAIDVVVPSAWSSFTPGTLDGLAGLTCGLYAVVDQAAPAGTSNAVGVLAAGPITFTTDPLTNTVNDVTITCTVVGATTVQRSSTVSGNTGSLLAAPVVYESNTGPEVCTTVEVNSTRGHSVLTFDADPTSPGDDCAPVS